MIAVGQLGTSSALGAEISGASVVGVPKPLPGARGTAPPGASAPPGDPSPSRGEELSIEPNATSNKPDFPPKAQNAELVAIASALSAPTAAFDGNGPFSLVNGASPSTDPVLLPRADLNGQVPSDIATFKEFACEWKAWLPGDLVPNDINSGLNLDVCFGTVPSAQDTAGAPSGTLASIPALSWQPGDAIKPSETSAERVKAQPVDATLTDVCYAEAPKGAPASDTVPLTSPKGRAIVPSADWLADGDVLEVPVAGIRADVLPSDTNVAAGGLKPPVAPTESDFREPASGLERMAFESGEFDPVREDVGLPDATLVDRRPRDDRVQGADVAPSPSSASADVDAAGIGTALDASGHPKGDQDQVATSASRLGESPLAADLETRDATLEASAAKPKPSSTLATEPDILLPTGEPKDVTISESTPRASADSPATSSDRAPISQLAESTLRQVADRIEHLAAVKPRRGVTIHLDPKELGTITITVKRIGEEVHAMLAASDENVRRDLADHRGLLVAALEAKGIQVAAVAVSADSQAPSMQFGQGSRDTHGRLSGSLNASPATQLEERPSQSVLSSWRTGSGVDLIA